MTPMPPHNFLSSSPQIPAEVWSRPEVRFLSVWEIPQIMKCPLMGTCLSIEDHQRLLKKAGVCTRRMSPAALHEAVMGNLDEASRVARRIDAFFRKTFTPRAEEWLYAPEAEIRALWEKGVLSGDIELPLYIIACRSNISHSFQFQVFGTLHMLGHTAKRDLMEARRTIVRLENTVAAERENFRRIQREMQEEKTRLQKEAVRLKELSTTKDSFTEPSEKKEEKAIDTLGERLRRLQEKNQGLTDRVRKLEAEREALRRQSPAREDAPLPLSVSPDNPTSGACFCIRKNIPADLTDKRVLVVGGRPCMRALYREAVESAGGRFEYHDGCIHGGKQTLESRVRRSDLVLCPVNCNSHGACGLVKDICRKHGKCLRMLDSSSRSAIEIALNRLAEVPAAGQEGIQPPPLIAGTRFSAFSTEEIPLSSICA